MGERISERLQAVHGGHWGLEDVEVGDWEEDDGLKRADDALAGVMADSAGCCLIWQARFWHSRRLDVVQSVDGEHTRLVLSARPQLMTWHV